MNGFEIIVHAGMDRCTVFSVAFQAVANFKCHWKLQLSNVTPSLSQGYVPNILCYIDATFKIE